MPQAGYFPNSIGNIYTYLVTDSLNNRTFNVNVSIIGKSTVSGYPVSIWAYSGQSYVDTNYVFSNKDSVLVWDKTKFIIINKYYIPFTMGAKWIGNHLERDTINVIDAPPLNVKAGKFPQTYLLKEDGHAENYNLIKYQWVVPNIGIVKMDIKAFTFGSPNIQTWELINYKIN